MLCMNCRSKSKARGIKVITCLKCSKETVVNYMYEKLCEDCSNSLHICQYCGKEV